MRHFIFSAFIVIMLLACARTNQDIQVLPSLTIIPSSTYTKVMAPTIKASETPLPPPTSIPLPSPSTTPVPLSLILADFPLALETTWVYLAEISYQDPNDDMKLLTWTGTITDKVVDKKSEADGWIVFTVQENLEPKPPEQVWRQSGSFEYEVSGDGVFEGGMKIYQYPLEDNTKWKAFFSSFNYEMVPHPIENINTPYGKLDNCYVFVYAIHLGTSVDTFCKGIGFVEHFYRHHGTPQNEKFVLSSFTFGQP